jgi:hypothetical protein
MVLCFQLQQRTYNYLVCFTLLLILSCGNNGVISFRLLPERRLSRGWTSRVCLTLFWYQSRNGSMLSKSCINNNKYSCCFLYNPFESIGSELGSLQPSKSSCDGSHHVVVVGGGVGGLAVAARIAANNQDNVKVTILEKNAQVGGRCGSFWVDVDSNSSNNSNNSSNHQRIRHERGPSLLLLPDVYWQLFEETTGKSAEEYGLKIIQCVPAYQVVFEDGDRISIGFPARAVTEDDASIRRQEAESRAKMNLYEPKGAEKWDEYMAITSAYLDCGLPNFIEERLDLTSFPNFLVQSLRDSAKVSKQCI